MTGRPTARRDEGATAVEFAIVSPILFVLVGGIMAVGLHLTYAAVSEHAVREGLRTATTRSATGYGTSADVTSRVNATVPGFLPSASSVTCTTDTTLTPCASTGRAIKQGEPVTVRATFKVPGVSGALSLVPFFGTDLSGLLDVSRTATGRRE